MYVRLSVYFYACVCARARVCVCVCVCVCEREREREREGNNKKTFQIRKEIGCASYLCFPLHVKTKETSGPYPKMDVDYRFTQVQRILMRYFVYLAKSHHIHSLTIIKSDTRPLERGLSEL